MAAAPRTARERTPRCGLWLRTAAHWCAAVCGLVVLALVVSGHASASVTWTNPCSADLDPGVCERVQYVATVAADAQHQDTWVLIGVLTVVAVAPGFWRVLLI